MPPITPQSNMPEDNSNDILIDATMETNDKLADIAESSDVQVQGIMETNAELNELNRSVDILIEKLTEEKPLKREDVDSIIDILTAIRDKETAETKVTIEVNGVEIESSKLYEETETGN